MASYVSNREGQLPGRLQTVQVTSIKTSMAGRDLEAAPKLDGHRLSPRGVPMVVANVEPLPRFILGSNVVSARSIRMIRNSESLTNVSRTLNNLSRLIVSNARLMSIPSTRNDV